MCVFADRHRKRKNFHTFLKGSLMFESRATQNSASEPWLLGGGIKDAPSSRLVLL